MVDTGTARSVGSGFSALGRRVAVGSGALIALISLLADAPVWVASGRGAATAIAGLLVIRFASASLEHGARDADTDA
jgi:hypothetical protein